MWGKTTIRNPVITWDSALRAGLMPGPGVDPRIPPPFPFTVTRSEVRITRRSTTVHIWYALVPAVRARP